MEKQRAASRTVLRAALVLVLAAAGLSLAAPTAHAAAIATLTVTTLDYVGNDANPGDGACATSGGACTLKAAIQESNALNAGPGDTVLIQFATGLTGYINGPDGDNVTNRMKTGVIALGWDHSGAYYHVTAPVTIDFGGDVGFAQNGDQGTAFFIDGPRVTITNFGHSFSHPNGTRQIQGIVGGETAFVVSANGDDFTLDTGAIVEASSNWLERGIILLDGAARVTVRDVTFDAFENLGGAIRILQNATIDGLTLDGVTMSNTVPEAGYYGVFAEGGVTIDDFNVIDTSFLGWKGDRVLWLRDADINGGRFEGNQFVDYVYTGFRYAIDTTGGSLTDVDFVGNTVDRMDADQFFAFNLTQLTDVNFTGNTFKDTLTTSYNLFDLRGATGNRVAVTGNTFTNYRNDGGWKMFDLSGGSTWTDLTISGNTFTDVAGTGSLIDARGANLTRFTFDDNDLTRVSNNVSILDLRSATSDRVSFTDNDVTDSAFDWPAIWVTGISPNSPVSGNTFVNADATKKYGWVFVQDSDGYPNTTDTGWRVRDNHVQVAPGNNEAPIRVDSGFLPVERNTFSAPARGTTVAEDSTAQSETGGSWFVWNINANANFKLRTWYPTAAVIDTVTGRARITVSPPVAPGEDPDPGTPVSIDVYYTPGAAGQRQADRYLGRLTGVTAAGSYELACAGCDANGYLRVQTIASNGATTQYSRIVTPTVGSVGSSPVSIDLADGDTVPAGSTVTGTGSPGTTVEVVNTDNAEQLCDSTVDGGGTWSCVVEPTVTQGPATVVVQEVGPVVVASDPVSVTIVPAVVGVSLFGPGSWIGIVVAALGALFLVARRRRRVLAAAPVSVAG